MGRMDGAECLPSFITSNYKLHKKISATAKDRTDFYLSFIML